MQELRAASVNQLGFLVLPRDEQGRAVNRVRAMGKINSSGNATLKHIEKPVSIEEFYGPIAFETTLGTIYKALPRVTQVLNIPCTFQVTLPRLEQTMSRYQRADFTFGNESEPEVAVLVEPGAHEGDHVVLVTLTITYQAHQNTLVITTGTLKNLSQEANSGEQAR